MTASPTRGIAYQEIGTDQALTEIKTSFLAEFAARSSRAECPNQKTGCTRVTL